MGFIRNYKLSVLPLFLLLILLSTKVCSSSHEYCAPSSCGSIQNISYPFRLKDHHPNNCTKPGLLELSCENNNVTTIYLNSKRFIVKSITYHNFTIRLLDPGYSASSYPLHFLTDQDVDRNYFPYLDIGDRYYDGSYINMWLTYISCSSHININTITKSKSNENNEYYYYYEAPSTSACGFDSHFPAENYSYIVYGPTLPLKNSCRMKRASMVSKKAPAAAAKDDGLVGGVGNYNQQLQGYTY